jgi:cleavage stimulation factor subunit 2
LTEPRILYFCPQAQLIMQVLQLSDEQIAALPPEQRQSILVLKEQIAKSSQR